MKFTYRIKKEKIFKFVFRKGKYSIGKCLMVHTSKIHEVKNKNNSLNAFAVCVSKKNGNSVQRNKLKRWVREAYKMEEESLSKNNNIIVLYKKGTNINNTNLNLVSEDLKKCFKELKLYEN